MNFKHEAQYKKLEVELDVKEVELKEWEHRKMFYEVQYFFLGKQHLVFIKKGKGSNLHPHPLCNPNVLSNIKPNFLKVAPCVVCFVDFLTMMYHPWCALMHFKQRCRCVDPHYKVIVSFEWYKGFGFKEFDKELLEKKSLRVVKMCSCINSTCEINLHLQVAPMLVNIVMYTIELYSSFTFNIECFNS
jgi:hypothetical protein